MSKRSLLMSAILGLFASSAFAVTFIPIAGDIEVRTSSNRRSAVVTVSNNGSVAAQFCVSFPEPLPRPIHIAETGQVIFAPQPIEGLPPGMKISGPEPIAQSLTVVPSTGEALAFVAKGVKPIHGGARPILISNVSRQDWPGPGNTRRGLGVEACLSAGG